MSDKPNLNLIDNKEGDFLPKILNKICDSHIHIFPDKIFEALRGWFEMFGWPLRYKLNSVELINFLLDKGFSNLVVFPFSHKPGMSDYLNSYTADIAEKFSGKVIGLATIFPGEDNASLILEKGFKSNLMGVKLHAHVQCFDFAADYMNEVFDTCEKYDKPLLIHAGREPKSEAYPCDPHKICSAQKTAKILKERPNLKICVPHLGVDEFDVYKNMAFKFDNLWLDTAMVISDYLIKENNPDLSTYRKDRLIYGSDFPNIPFAWDTELKEIIKNYEDKDFLNKIFYENSKEFFGF